MAMLVITGLVDGCDSGGGQSTVPIPVLKYQRDYLTFGETLEVEITQPDSGALVTNVSETDLAVAIEQLPCVPAADRCVRWLITPSLDAEAGDYRIGVGHRSTQWKTVTYKAPLSGQLIDTATPVDFAEIHFKLLPAKAAAAATTVAIATMAQTTNLKKSTLAAVVTTDGEVWAWGYMNRSGSLVTRGGMEHLVADRPYYTGINNARAVYFAGDSKSLFYVFKTDGSVDIYQNMGSWEVDDFVLVDQVRDENGVLANNISSISDRYALLSTGEVRHIQPGTLDSRLEGQCSTEDSLTALNSVVQVVREGSARLGSDLDFLTLFLKSDGTIEQNGYHSNTGYASGCALDQVSLSNVAQVGVGLTTAFPFGTALLSDGTVWVWLNQGSNVNLLRQVPGLANVAEIAVDLGWIVARDSLGAVSRVSVAADTSGNSFDFAFSAPETMSGVSGASAIATRGGLSLALLGDCSAGGRVLSWDATTEITGSGVFGHSLQAMPVIGIGDTDPSCSRLALFYPSTQLTSLDSAVYQFQVDTNTGNMACNEAMCWELASANSTLLTTVTQGNFFSVRPVWDCEAAGNNQGMAFSLAITDRDIYCKLITNAHQMVVDFAISGAPVALNNFVIDTVPANVLTLKTDHYEGLLDPGTIFQLQPYALNDYTLSGFSGDCDSNGQVVMPTRDANCTVRFAEPVAAGDFTLTVVIQGGPNAGEVLSNESPAKLFCINQNEVTTNCSASYAQGSVVELSSIEFGTKVVSNWSGCTLGVDVNNQPICSLTMDADHTVTATFADAPPPSGNTLTVVLDGGPAVAALVSGESPTPYLNCTMNGSQTTATCSAIFTPGSAVALYKTVGSGYIMQLVGCTAGIDANENAFCGVTMDTDRTVLGHLIPVRNLNLTIAGQVKPNTTYVSFNTSIQSNIFCVNQEVPSETCSFEVPQGDALTFRIPFSDYPIQSWSGCTPGVNSFNEPICTLTMDADHAVTATFAGPPPPVGSHTLTVTVDGNVAGGSAQVQSSETPDKMIVCNLLSASGSSVTCSNGYYAPGSSVVLSGTAYPSAILGWEGCTPDMDINFNAQVCRLTMDTDHTVMMHVTPSYTLNVTIDGQTQVGISTVFTANTTVRSHCYSQMGTSTLCQLIVPRGEDILLDWDNTGGADIQSWAGDCTPELDANNRSVCRILMDADHSVTATFGP